MLVSVNRYVDNSFELPRIHQEAILTSPSAVRDDGYAQFDIGRPICIHNNLTAYP